jgi:hypothetical protein
MASCVCNNVKRTQKQYLETEEIMDVEVDRLITSLGAVPVTLPILLIRNLRTTQILMTSCPEFKIWHDLKLKGTAHFHFNTNN